MQINPAMVPFKTRPFPSTIVFTIQCLKISGLEFGSKHSNEMICKHVNPAEIRINHMFIVIFVSVTILQTQSTISIKTTNKPLKFVVDFSNPMTNCFLYCPI